MSGKRIGYIRVSTIDQNPERQLDGISLDKKFIEYASGTTLKRPELDLLLEYVRDDDLVIVHSLDRLARNMKDLRKVIDAVIEKGAQISFIKENLIFNGKDSPISNLILSVLGAMAEFEHSIIHERLMEGIAIAKSKGRFRGRQRVLTKEKEEMILELLKTRMTKSEIATKVGISRPTLYNFINGEKKVES